jgi:hypothetical protein
MTLTRRLLKIVRSELKVRPGERFPEQAARFRFVRGPFNDEQFDLALESMIAAGILRKTGPRNSWIELLE